MLHTETVEPGTLSLLKKLMAMPSLEFFSLVGGTAMSLRYGHRSSIHLDLVFHKKFDHVPIENELVETFGGSFVYEGGHKQLGIFCNIQKVKVDIVYFPHLPIAAIEVEDNIRMYSCPDIGAMKIQAILGRGKKKDFWDLFELLQHYSLQQIMDWHKQKYPTQMLAISIPNAITYFVDADESEEPVSFKKQTWVRVKKGIQQVVRDYLK
ncbi:MAG: nucleotidyl transferase AbiEii/AbiGii toxin family protein [Bacteroidia bacterium]|nr:nucleotidyl transferase AbiEii/AbiGii toxin family protein [Bacteroidia bacterium]